jgi:predicted ABC-type ATPase
MEVPELDHRPIIVAIAGPNGAGKSTFFHTHIAFAGLRFLEPDALAIELGADAYTAAKMADALRRGLMGAGESFAFETVFSDPAGDKLKFLKEAIRAGYTVVMCFIGIADPELSETRVAMRVSQGGHDVPTEKIHSRFPRIMANLRAAVSELPIVYVFDNSDIGNAFRKISVFKQGQQIYANVPLPEWFDISLH